MMKKGIQIYKNFKTITTVLLFLFLGHISQAQSCVCFQDHFLNDYKEADFIAQIKVTAVDANLRMDHEDQVEFTTTTIFKGEERASLFIQQEVGNSMDNSRCKLFLNPGDEIIIFASLIDDELITTPCKRNRFIYKNDPTFDPEVANLINTLNSLSQFNPQIEESAINCASLQDDTDVIKEIAGLDQREVKSFFGLYNIKFNEDESIQSIGVVSSFNKEIDKKIRIMLIKKRWKSCELNENNELLIGYFYHPKSSYRESYLSTY